MIKAVKGNKCQKKRAILWSGQSFCFRPKGNTLGARLVIPLHYFDHVEPLMKIMRLRRIGGHEQHGQHEIAIIGVLEAANLQSIFQADQSYVTQI